MAEIYYLINGIAALIVLLLLILFFPDLMQWNEGMRRKHQNKLRETQKQSVRESSKWYQAVLALNEEIHYYDQILNQGHGEYRLSVNSKARYDKTSTEVCLTEYVERYRDMLEQALEQTRRNAVIYDMYARRIMALRVEPTEAQCVDAKITMEEYLDLEREIIQETELPIQRTYCVTCHVYYISPQGRNHYRKSDTYSADDILTEMMRQDNQAAYHASEAWRRKTERSRVTPSVRYRIMMRDGFRCCVCGRSASSGVELEVDHVVAISNGGNSDDDNLQTLCRDCNRGKGASI